MNKMRKCSMLAALIVILAMAFAGAAGAQVAAKANDQTAVQIDNKRLNEQLIMAVLWMQTSAEYRALCYQAFNLAQLRLDAFLGGRQGGKPVAVVVDADETVIDNSAYEAWLVEAGVPYSSKTWGAWMQDAQAIAMPGAKEFFDYAAGKGVEIFYVTNRKMEGYEGTAKNLAALGFPNVDKKHLLLRTKSSDKQARREAVAADYDIALLMGDNLNDFMSVFGHKNVAARLAENRQDQKRMGQQVHRAAQSHLR